MKETWFTIILYVVTFGGKMIRMVWWIRKWVTLFDLESVWDFQFVRAATSVITII